nr:hypothetical protein [Phytohabitans rumicis]
MIVAEDAAAPGQGLLVQRLGLLGIAQPAQVDGQVVGRRQRVGWSSPRALRRRARVSSSRARACSALPSARMSLARLLAEVKVCAWSSPRARRRRARVSSSSVRACS